MEAPKLKHTTTPKVLQNGTVKSRSKPRRSYRKGGR